MPSSAVDICNLALSHIGDEAAVIDIDPPDGTIQSVQCGRFYPIARDELLEMHEWTFAVVRINLAAAVAGAPTEWAYAYAMPAKCLKILSLLRAGARSDERGEDFIVESDDDGNGVIYTTWSQPRCATSS